METQRNERYAHIEALAVRAQAGDRDALEALIIACEGIVCRMAARYARRTPRLFTREDLEQEARIVLWEAVTRYRKEGAFVAYARAAIKSRLSQALRSDALINLPWDAASVRRISEQLRARGESPTPEAVAAQTPRMNAARAQDIQIVEQMREIALDAPAYMKECETRHETTAAGGRRPTEDLALNRIQAAALRAAVAAALANPTLTEHEREAARARYSGASRWARHGWAGAKSKLRKLLAAWKPPGGRPIYRGVIRREGRYRVRWEAYLRYFPVPGREIKRYVGSFNSPRAAAEAVDDAAWATLGAEAKLNFPARYAVTD